MQRRVLLQSLGVAAAGLVFAVGLSAKEATVTLTIKGMT